MCELDVLIVGAGPAGLVLASRLALQHRVVVIDQGAIGDTTKFWVTTAGRLERHNLSPCARRTAPGLIVGTFLGSRVMVPGDVVVVDDQACLRLLASRCQERGAKLLEHCALVSLSWTKACVTVMTTMGEFQARLVIDATGGSSPFARTFRLHRIDGFYMVYGALLRNINLRTSNVVLAFVDHLGDPPAILEVIPYQADCAYCAVFTFARSLIPPSALAGIFREHCQQNPFFAMTERSDTGPLKVGSIPIGSMRHRVLPGIVPFGEAGMIQPPLLGTAFNEILEYADPLAGHLSQLLHDTTGVPVDGRYRYPVLKRAQDRLQLALARIPVARQCRNV